VTIVSDVIVTLDERVRTWTAVLAAAGWADLEQTQEPHGVHLQSKALSQYLNEQEGVTTAAVVNSVDNLLKSGASLSDILAEVLADQADALTAFAQDVNLESGLWADHTAVWQEAVDHLQEIVANAPIEPFCQTLLPQGQQLPAKMTIVPTLTYPMLSTVVANDGDNLIAVVPPPKAWGASSPWPYAEWADEVLGRVVRELAGALLASEMGGASADQLKLMKFATAVLFLEEAFGEDTGMSYMVQKKREEGIPQLPLAVEWMRDHVANPNETPLMTRFG